MAKPPDGQSCATCRFHDDANMAGWATCRKSPPAPGDHGGNRIRQPESHNTWWCGEYVCANPETIEDGAVVLARLVLLGDRAAAYALADKLKAREV